jgi:hypothetical protein
MQPAIGCAWFALAAIPAERGARHAVLSGGENGWPAASANVGLSEIGSKRETWASAKLAYHRAYRVLSVGNLFQNANLFLRDRFSDLLDAPLDSGPFGSRGQSASDFLKTGQTSCQSQSIKPCKHCRQKYYPNARQRWRGQR